MSVFFFVWITAPNSSGENVIVNNLINNGYLVGAADGRVEETLKCISFINDGGNGCIMAFALNKNGAETITVSGDLEEILIKNNIVYYSLIVYNQATTNFSWSAGKVGSVSKKKKPRPSYLKLVPNISDNDGDEQ